MKSSCVCSNVYGVASCQGRVIEAIIRGDYVCRTSGAAPVLLIFSASNCRQKMGNVSSLMNKYIHFFVPVFSYQNGLVQTVTSSVIEAQAHFVI